MTRKRRRFGSSFKAKVAIEAIKETRTISELAKKHKLHATQTKKKGQDSIRHQ